MIDLAPFQSAMPPAVRAAIEGPAGAYLRGRMEAHDVLALEDEVAGWLTGIRLFDLKGEFHVALVDTIARHARPPVVPHVIAAFAAGIVAGVAPKQRQWTRIEIVSCMGELPDVLAAALPAGCMSSAAADRESALHLAARVGDRARSALTAACATADAKQAKRLRAALAALASVSPGPHRDDELLARCVAAWGETRDPRLAGPIARLGKRVAARRPVVAAVDDEREALWIALARRGDPGDVDRLLDTMGRDQMPGKIGMLAHHCRPDPRIAARIEGIGPVMARDRGVIAHAQRVHGGAQLRSCDPDLLDEANAAAPALVDIAALYDDLVCAPQDDALRAVIADALLELGDPRGELIVLQRAIEAGTADRAARNRAAVLIEQHADAFAGPLPVMTIGRRFAGGFLVDAMCVASAEAFVASLAHWQWCTVERLALGVSWRDARPLRELPSLRALLVNDGMLATLEQTGPYRGIRYLGCSGVRLPRHRFAFPDLEVLAVEPGPSDDDLRAVHRAAVALEVRAVVHHLDRRRLGAALGARRAGPPELYFARSHLVFDPPGWRLRVWRDAPRAEASGLAEDAVATVLGELARAGITEVALHGVPEQAFDLPIAVRFDGAPVSFVP